MPQITFVHPDGLRSVVDAPAGTTVRDVAVDDAIDGILGQCGGRLVCATCHVFVEEVDGAPLPELGDDEDEMLDYTAEERRPNSRLGCRLTIGEDLAGLVVRVPESQT
ncbi:2Fe-2S iron-sulfur cluster-binding protein [Streptomyces sp. NPDC049099]|uniref:2Fe-2S iron-sulfur cluster-binding protein n=1 Tax=unclassified Streptomyces TaxID=2593676 RepID=UPI00342B2A59